MLKKIAVIIATILAFGIALYFFKVVGGAALVVIMHVFPDSYPLIFGGLVGLLWLFIIWRSKKHK